MNPYTAHQMGIDSQHRQPIMGIFNGNGKMVKQLNIAELCKVYAAYRAMLRTLRAIQKANTLEESKTLVNQILGDEHE